MGSGLWNWCYHNSTRAVKIKLWHLTTWTKWSKTSWVRFLLGVVVWRGSIGIFYHRPPGGQNLDHTSTNFKNKWQAFSSAETWTRSSLRLVRAKPVHGGRSWFCFRASKWIKMKCPRPCWSVRVIPQDKCDMSAGWYTHSETHTWDGCQKLWKGFRKNTPVK